MKSYQTLEKLFNEEPPNSIMEQECKNETKTELQQF